MFLVQSLSCLVWGWHLRDCRLVTFLIFVELKVIRNKLTRGNRWVRFICLINAWDEFRLSARVARWWHSQATVNYRCRHSAWVSAEIESLNIWLECESIWVLALLNLIGIPVNFLILYPFCLKVQLIPNGALTFNLFAGRGVANLWLALKLRIIRVLLDKHQLLTMFFILLSFLKDQVYPFDALTIGCWRRHSLIVTSLLGFSHRLVCCLTLFAGWAHCHHKILPLSVQLVELFEQNGDIRLFQIEFCCFAF